MSDNHPQLHADGTFHPLQSAGSSSQSLTSKTQVAGAHGEIQHVIYLAENIGSLYNSPDFSDVTLKVDGTVFPAHRVILAARSEYFRALLFNGMRESNDNEVELVDTNVSGFRILLKYIYTGKVSLSSLKEELVFEVLGLTHKYGFNELELSVSEYLKAILNVRNMCTIYEAAQLFTLKSLSDVCLNFADKHASEVLATQGFLQLSANAVELMVQRDSLCAPEIDIFKALREWVRQHPEQVEESDQLVTKLRLSLMKLDDLLTIVRPSGLISSDIILDAIKEQQEKKSVELLYRGYLLPNVNVATASLNASVISGEGGGALLSGDISRYDNERGYTQHLINEKTQGIVVELGRPYIINHMRLLLWDRDQRSYHYYIEVSMDKQDWIRVVDHTKYLCRSKQTLFFPPRVVKFIRIIGTHNSVNSSFHMVSMQAMFSTEPFNIDSTSTLIVPSTNVATITNNATVIEGVSRSRNALINGETGNYDWDNGYTCHQLGSGAIVVQLPQPYLIDSIRLLLWDCDDRHYSYYIEVSCDQNSWTRVADRTQDQCKAWQILRFERRPVVFVRIVGTHNSANEVFHCVHFECPAQRASVSPFEGSPSPSTSQPNNEVVVYDANNLQGIPQ